MKYKIYMVILILTFCCRNFCFAGVLSASVNQIKEDIIEFYLGYTDGLRKDTELSVIRKGKEIAKIKVIKLGAYFSEGQIISKKEEIKIGDLVTTNSISSSKTSYTKTQKASEKSSTLKTGKICLKVGKDLEINLGKRDGIKEEDELQVTDKDGKKKGKIKIIFLGNNYSVAEIIEEQKDTSISYGDVVTISRK